VIEQPCDMCGTALAAADLPEYGEVFLAHVRADHADLPFPDSAVRNYGEGLARMTGPSERLDTIGTVAVHRVTEDRIDDFLRLFDTDVAVGTPQNSGCYCLEPHEVGPNAPKPAFGHWSERRAAMVERLRAGTTYGYLAYVDGRPAGWCNASMRGDYALFRRDDAEDASTVAVSCFAIAPPYRGHGVSRVLLGRVLADAGARGAAAIEAYPLNEGVGFSGFRGPPPLYETSGFTPVEVRQHDTVVRRPV
jgi:GNAT superfamily N-acetyltransferase